MSLPSKKDLHTPFNSPTIDKLRAFLGRAVVEQATAADATPVATVAADHAGQVRMMDVTFSDAAAANESMVVDVQVNGSSILTGTFTFNHSSSGKQFDLMPYLDSTKSAIAVGDLIEVDLAYTAGGGPTMNGTRVTVGWS